MPGPPVDMAALSDATADMMKYMSGDKAVGRTAVQKLDADADAFREKNLSPSDRAARATRQEEHAAKLRKQRAGDNAKEALADAERRQAAKRHAAGTMGIGRVPVDAGGVAPAFEYELHFDSLELFVPLPPTVTKAKQLRVAVGARTLSVGLAGGQPPYIKGTFKGTVHPDEVVWTLDTARGSAAGAKELRLEITKAAPGQSWAGALDLDAGWRCQWESAATNRQPAAAACEGTAAACRERPAGAGAAAATACTEASLAAMMAAAAPSLLANGYAILDDALDASTAALLRGQMEALRSGGGLRQHRFGFRPDASSPAQVITKPHIFEAETTDPAVASLAPPILAQLDRLEVPRAAQRAFPSLELVGATAASGGGGGANGGDGGDASGVVIKLQCNEGGGACFPLHYDNAGPPSKRRLTCLFYLSDEWKPSDGGELELVPWLGEAVTIPPLSGRCVLFLSDVLLHRVLPSHRRRFCFTIWLDARDGATNRPEHLRLDVRAPRPPGCLSSALAPSARTLARVPVCPTRVHLARLARHAPAPRVLSDVAVTPAVRTT